MSCNWPTVTLDECASFQEGYVNPTQKKEYYFDGPVKWLRAVDLNNGPIRNTSRTLSEEGFKSAGKSALLFEPGTLAISKSGTIGRIGILEDYMCGNRAVINIKVNKDKCDNLYIFYVLLMSRRVIETLAVGSVQKNLYTSALGSLELRLPPLQVQAAIAKQLSDLDKKIDLNTQTNQTLEQMAQAIFKSWFVDFDPVKAKMNGEQPEGMDAATASLFPEKLVESELGLIPDGWNIKSIKDFGDVICGKTPSKKNADFYGGHVPFIKIPDTHGKVFITETSDTLTQAGDESQPKKRIPENSICVSCIATVGQVFITTKPSHTNQQINSVVPYDQNSLYYLLFKFKGLNKHFHDLASGGSATLNMNTSTFSKVALVRPTADVLEAFHKTVGGLMEKMLANQLENATLSELRDTLLPKLLSGEIELAEKAES
ncbi:restriction endonuclease subunit S [Photobacterium lucens]|uniref:restriction endonuclease subunit S n=1 Tax=Photobacterium lucens TaxID=2562949 RepID=UPI00136B3736|nr:restriction endonuclease subunit S [Photobacterium lucens]MBP2700050.1 restriction endonuclease subunit S [Vibrio parahaemolyticus]MZG80362.1 restriction endonuclease subunit S [Photobacterium lucens]